MIRLGLQIPSFTYPGVADDALFERVSDIAVTAEESGFDSIWVMDQFEEAVQICRGTVTQETATFDGQHYRVKDAINNPRPIRPEGIQIMVGGGGEKRTLRIVAAHADGCNLFGQPDEVRHKLDVL